MAESSNRVRWTALTVGAVLVALIAVLVVGPDDRLNPGNQVLGTRVPAIEGETITGGRYDIDDARGKWVIVNFFATWCTGCINEHPELVELDKWARETGNAELVAVVFNDPVEEVEAFFAEAGGGWPVLNDPAIPIDFQVSQIPETFIVAPSGQVVQHIQGEVQADQVIALMEDR